MYKIITDSIYLPYLKKDRTIRVYLPPHYDETDCAYPVIYMHDAQNLFDPATSSYGAIWDVHTHLNALYDSTGKGIIVVGIDNYEGRHNRLDEYSPWLNTSLKDNELFADITIDVGGLGHQYVEYIVKKLKPIIDKRYRTLTDAGSTAVIGSSMGGLISLYAGLMYPQTFSKVGAFSTAVWFAEKELLSLLQSKGASNDTLWYLDVGTKENGPGDDNLFNALYLAGTQKVYEHLLPLTRKEQVMLIIEEGGIHNERDWSRRYTQAIEFLFEDYFKKPTT